VLTRRLILIGALLTFAGCSLEEQGAPGLSGPSELGLSLAVTASPDIINQDGVSQSQITVTARDAAGMPAKGVSMRVDLFLGGTPSDFGTIGTRTVSTNNDGQATVMYTAPPEPPATATSDNTVQVTFTPIGTNYANSLPRSVSIRLVRPGAIAIPNTDLKAAFSFTPEAPKVGDMIAFDGSASSVNPGRTIVSYKWSFGNGDTGTGKLTTHAYNQAGIYAVTLTVTDDLGRTASTSKTISLNSSLPTADFVMSPDSPFVGEPVVFNAKSSKAATGRTIVNYEWEFGDAKPATSGPSASVTHAFDSARKFTVVLTVTDDIGQSASVSKTIDISDVKAVFSFALPSPIPSSGPVTVTFDATSSKPAPGATIVSYIWNFCSGCAPVTTTSPATTYDYPGIDGTYVVTLTVRDSNDHTVTSAAQTVKITIP
jgi:PKD repeat protein